MSGLLIIIFAILGIGMLVITIANFINLVLFLVPVAHNEWGWNDFWQTDNFWVWVIALIILIGVGVIARILVGIIRLAIMLITAGIGALLGATGKKATAGGGFGLVIGLVIGLIVLLVLTWFLWDSFYDFAEANQQYTDWFTRDRWIIASMFFLNILGFLSPNKSSSDN